mmetsp:Transcript_21016/g.66378  ORF Transcript_21016/g.66378 Transcript_21016/m.66378 type:complete len:223 (-) Transcript_21016:769-1437(-)
MKAHWRPGSCPCFMKTSIICPYLENSARNTASVAVSGNEPTKIFRGPSMPSGWLVASKASPAWTTMGIGATSRPTASWPRRPWCLAIVTSHGRSEPGKLSSLSQASLASWACSWLAKVMKAHWRFDSHVVLRKISVICPYLENSACNMSSVMPSGKEPTKTFLGALCASDSKAPVATPVATGALSCIAVAGAPPAIGSCPNIPWFRAKVTSQGLMPPANCRM